MTGKLYGVGVGPGDPELLTLKAVRILESSDIIAIPNSNKEKCVAYKIAVQSVPSLEEKEMLCISMPMTKDKDILKKSHEEGAKAIIEKLNQGKKISFITLGDPTIYSTYLYIHRLVLGEGYDTEIISGIPSFCAAAARINEGLVENFDELHVIPASYQIRDALSLPGTKVLMKSGKKMNEVREILKGTESDSVMVENCGMENEKVYRDINDIKDDSSYYSLIIVKEK
ncbi:precorrin-2 C(20)-methyltransferase [Clostridium sp. HBUAS56017]|uniref:precorrin-2 C(20)-methyltransferase n=1 Tax=Clostridium sp. HBUAS56017 TaxID=2571128 RepID=UPI0011780940|nr:precorrin-2 C(20)-methyltransferase [Clostridium sp. HBUAS56017]